MPLWFWIVLVAAAYVILAFFVIALCTAARKGDQQWH